MGANFSAYKTFIAGETLTASDLNSSVSTILTNFTPAGMDDYSANVTEMRTTTDPYPAAAASLATSLQGELERIRYVIAQITGETYWYIDPDTTIAAINTAVTTLQGYFTAGVANKANLPAAIAYEDEANSFTGGLQTINGVNADATGLVLKTGGTEVAKIVNSDAITGSTGDIAIYSTANRKISFFTHGSNAIKCYISTGGELWSSGPMTASGGYTQPGTGGETLKTIRGIVNANGTIAEGTGFTVGVSSNRYTITFSTAFSDIPAAVGIVEAGSGVVKHIVGYATASTTADFYTFDAAHSGEQNKFHFIVTGPV